MPLSIFTRRKRPVSITIEDQAIRFVRLKSTSPLVIDSVEEISLPSNLIVEGKIIEFETLAAILEEGIRDWGITKRPVQFLAPDQYVIIRKVAYPEDVQEDELKGHFFIEIGSTLYLPFDDPVFDVVPYSPNEDANEAILIASKESVLSRYEELMRDVKLDPIVADIAPLALYRLAFTQHQFTGDEHVLLADLKGDKLTVSIFHQHYPLFMRPIEVESSADLAIVTDHNAPHITPAVLVLELEKLMNFYRYNMWNGTASITHVLWNGEYSLEKELLERLRVQFGVQANPLLREPLKLASGQEVPSTFNRTIGLALKEVL